MSITMTTPAPSGCKNTPILRNDVHLNINGTRCARRGWRPVQQRLACCRKHGVCMSVSEVSSGSTSRVSHRPQEEQKQEKQHSAYAWYRHWCPIAPLDMLDRERPTHHTILGKELAIWWNDRDKTWSAFKDMCPHRQAPLSLGRIQEGSLVCSYHGWGFGADGACNRIPQLTPEAQQRACASERACAVSYPTLVDAGVLYVWMDPSPAGLEASRTQGVARPPGVPQGQGEGQGQGEEGPLWNMMQLLGDYRSFAEQAMDPTHAMFLHAGMGFSSANAVPMESQGVAAVDQEQGFTWVHGGYEQKNKTMKATRHFIPPYNIIVTYEDPPKPTIVIWTLTVPVVQGECRVFISMNQVKSGEDLNITRDTHQCPPKPTASSTPWIFKLLKMLPHWLLSKSFVDQDLVVMHGQEQRMNAGELSKTQWRAARHEGYDLGAANYLPAAAGADAGVIAFHRWLSEVKYPQSLFGAQRPHGPATPAEGSGLPLETLLDRRRIHVDHCIRCQKALKFVTRLCMAVTAAAGLSAMTAVAVAVDTLLQRSSILVAGQPLLLAVTAAAALGAWAGRLWDMREERFISGLKHWQRKGGLSLVKMP